MKKKLTIIIGAVIVVAAVVSQFAWKKSDNSSVVMRKDAVSGQSIYANTEYGFSVAYSSDWQGPAERIEADQADEDSAINAIFLNASSSEGIVIQGLPGDTESFNTFAAKLDSAYTVVTIGGVPALRYEYVAPINEEGSAYAKTVTLVVKGLKNGSVTIAYQRITKTEAQAKTADISKFNDFISHITFN